MIRQKKYKIFISYARKDSSIARPLKKLLDENEITYWNENKIKPEGAIGQSTKNALDECEYLIALIKPTTFRSVYVREEIERATFRKDFKNKIIPVYIGDRYKSDFESTPWFLKELNGISVPDDGNWEKASKKIYDELVTRIHGGQ